jgi:hypothetical protein
LLHSSSDIASSMRGLRMGSLIFFAVLPALLLLGLLVLALKLSRRESRPVIRIDDLLPVHYRHFEEVDRRLVEYDDVLRGIQFERREFALVYLAELRGDFERVEELLNYAAKFLPEITVRGESERFLIGVKFRFQYRLVELQVRFGIVPVRHLQALTAKVGFLARSADLFLNEIAQKQGLGVLESDLNN